MREFSYLCVCLIALRLLCIYTMCKILCDLHGEYMAARKLAEETFVAASSVSNSLDADAVSMLQRIRDVFMTISPAEVKSLRAQNPLITRNPAIPAHISRPNSPIHLAEELLLDTSAEAVDTAPGVETTMMSEFGTSKGAPVLPNYNVVRRIRANVSLDFPIRLETMHVALHIVPALDYIFRAYVRGNSLPGQQLGAQDVVLGDNKLTMGKFLLQVVHH